MLKRCYPLAVFERAYFSAVSISIIDFGKTRLFMDCKNCRCLPLLRPWKTRSVSLLWTLKTQDVFLLRTRKTRNDTVLYNARARVRVWCRKCQDTSLLWFPLPFPVSPYPGGCLFPLYLFGALWAVARCPWVSVVKFCPANCAYTGQ